MHSRYGIRHVYYADDDPDDRFLFQEVLAEIDPTIVLTVTESGSILLEELFATPHTPDIVFLDWNMPVKNGFQCLQEIKRHERLRSIPVVIISTSSENIITRQSLEKGAFQYIQKPVYFHQLRTLIEECFRSLHVARDGRSSLPG